VIIRFVDIAGIVVHHHGQEFHQYQENELSPLSSDGQQFHI
jgi:hypothetical protein